MNLSVDTAQFSLDAGQTVVVRDGRGASVMCASGVLWITQDHDTRDVVLESGASFVLDRRGVAVVTAIEPSRMRMAAPHKLAA